MNFRVLYNCFSIKFVSMSRVLSRYTTYNERDTINYCQLFDNRSIISKFYQKIITYIFILFLFRYRPQINIDIYKYLLNNYLILLYNITRYGIVFVYPRIDLFYSFNSVSGHKILYSILFTTLFIIFLL